MQKKKTDYKKKFKHLYTAKKDKPSIIEIPSLKYLIFKGKGQPQEKNFQDAAGTLFPAAYFVKFLIKEQNPDNDFVVMPMEVK